MDIVAKIETDWKADKLSNVKIAKKHSVTEGYVRKMVKLYAWERGTPVAPSPTPPIPQAELKSSRPVAPPVDNREYSEGLLRRMLDELDVITSHIGEIEELIETETENDRDMNRRKAMMKAVSLPVRAETLKKLLMAQGAGSAASAAAKVGKKEQQDDAARKVASGRFAPSAVPLRVVRK